MQKTTRARPALAAASPASAAAHAGAIVSAANAPNIKPLRIVAGAFLAQAAESIERHAEARDIPATAITPQQRAMASAVNAFNAIEGTSLDERQGNMLLVMLQAAYARNAAANGAPSAHDYVTGAAFLAMAGESVAYTAPGA